MTGGESIEFGFIKKYYVILFYFFFFSQLLFFCKNHFTLHHQLGIKFIILQKNKTFYMTHKERRASTTSLPISMYCHKEL